MKEILNRFKSWAVWVSIGALDVSGTITDAVSGATYTHSTANAAAVLNAY